METLEYIVDQGGTSDQLIARLSILCQQLEERVIELHQLNSKQEQGITDYILKEESVDLHELIAWLQRKGYISDFHNDKGDPS